MTIFSNCTRGISTYPLIAPAVMPWTKKLAEDEIDDERRDGGEQRGRHVDVVVGLASAVMTTLARITVIGCVPMPPKVRPMRKSFQTW